MTKDYETLGLLLALCDREDAEDRVAVGFRITREEHALLQRTARLTQRSQNGVVRVGLRLVAEQALRRSGQMGGGR